MQKKHNAITSKPNLSTPFAHRAFYTSQFTKPQVWIKINYRLSIF